MTVVSKFVVSYCTFNLHILELELLILLPLPPLPPLPPLLCPP